MKSIRLNLLLLFFCFFSLNTVAQEYVRLTNLPHVYINTFNNRRITSKDYYIYCTLVYVDESDHVFTYDSVEIRGRGNSTWGLSKKPYKIKFYSKEKFLGKGYANAKKWTLLANAGDKTLIRNAITSEMGDWLGMKNSPARKFVDLTLNGEFLGNYQISDQVEVKAHRVKITEQDYPLTDESDITGGYLLEVDGFHDGNWFYSSHNLGIRIHYPEEEEIVTSQNNYIKNYINEFERVLFSDNFADPVDGYRQYVDSASLFNLYIATEVSANIDGFYSMYFYKDQQDPLIYFGPLWDYDIAYDNDYRISETERKLMVNDGYGDGKIWFNRFWQDSEWFGRNVYKRYKKALDDGLVDFLYTKIDSLSNLLSRSQQLNYEKWGIRTRMYHEITLYSSYQEYINELKQFISDHTQYLLTAFESRKPIDPTPPLEPEKFYYKILNVNTSKAIDIDNPFQYSEDNYPGEGTGVSSWEDNDTYESQLWEFKKVGDYFMIINKYGLALNDPTIGECTETTNLNTQLNVDEADPENPRQLWTIKPQGTQGYYNLINVYSKHTANLSGGSNNNGTKILSYETTDRNATSVNRLWYIVKSKIPLPEEPPTGIRDINSNVSTDYALVYNSQEQTLRFAGEDPSQLTFKVNIYTASGMLIDSFHANQVYSVADLPSNVYIVSWMTNGKMRSAKFTK